MPDQWSLCQRGLTGCECMPLQDVLEKVGHIPENVLSLITARILVGLTYLHRQKHMVRAHT